MVKLKKLLVIIGLFDVIYFVAASHFDFCTSNVKYW